MFTCQSVITFTKYVIYLIIMFQQLIYPLPQFLKIYNNNNRVILHPAKRYLKIYHTYIYSCLHILIDENSHKILKNLQHNRAQHKAFNNTFMLYCLLRIQQNRFKKLVEYITYSIFTPF